MSVPRKENRQCALGNNFSKKRIQFGRRLVVVGMGSTAATTLETDELSALAAAQPSAIVSVMNADSESTNACAEHGEARLSELLRAVANNDRTAFEAFYNATTERALSLVLRITQRIEIAEEVVSDVYLQVWHQADRFDPARGNAFAWLTVLCRSRALDTLRKNNAMPTHGAAPISEIPEQQADDFSQDLLIAIEEHSAVHVAMQMLEPTQRQLLALAYFRGYTHSELAQFTGMPLGTVKTQLRRTLKKLKDFMVGSETEKRASA